MPTSIEMFLKWEQQRPHQTFLRQPLDGGVQRAWTWQQAGDEARRIAAGLRAQGLQPGDKVAILSKNCAHWVLADIATMMGGFISVPLYATITAETVQLVLEHSGTKAVIIGKLDNYASQAGGIPASVIPVHIEAYGTTGRITWEALVDKNAPIEEVVIPDAKDIMTIMYTSVAP